MHLFIYVNRSIFLYFITKNWIVFTYFQKLHKYQILPMEAGLILADGGTDGYNETNRRI